MPKHVLAEFDTALVTLVRRRSRNTQVFPQVYLFREALVSEKQIKGKPNPPDPPPRKLSLAAPLDRCPPTLSC